MVYIYIIKVDTLAALEHSPLIKLLMSFFFLFYWDVEKSISSSLAVHREHYEMLEEAMSISERCKLLSFYLSVCLDCKQEGCNV